MTQTHPITYFDGKTSKAHQATIEPVYYHHKLDGFIVHHQGKQVRYFLKDYEYLPKVAQGLYALEMKDGARIEFASTPPDWLPLSRQSTFDFIHKMESSGRWLLLSLLAVLLTGFVFLRFGVPMVAHHVAMNLPPDTLNTAGNEAQDYIMQMTEPSKLSHQRQQQIIKLYQRLPNNTKANIIIRQGGDSIDANALALPNNTIIITDELIALSDDDRQILAVLAHEQGHITHRHSLQQALSLLGIGVITVMVTGDMSDTIATIPTLLTSLHYSREFEREADQFAINELKALGESPEHLANFFKHMQHHHDDEGSEGGHWSIISTHPDTNERIANAQSQK